jgi:Uma2 family endonuclease
MGTKALITAEEFTQMNSAESENYELVEGELIPMASPTPDHADIRFHAEYLVRSYFKRNPIGVVFSEIDCRLTAETVRKPDVAVFLGQRSKQIDLQKIPVPFAPDIAVEVLSPSETAVDVHRKVRQYLNAGTSEVWLLDHANEELFVHTNTAVRLLLASDHLESPLLPGFSVAVADLFAGF